MTRRHGAALLLAWGMAAGGAAVAAPSDDTVPAGRYADCLAAARAKPAEALRMAEAWRAADGGFPAAHCAAVALVNEGKYAAAAQRLESLAAAMMTADPTMRADALEQAGHAWLLDGKPVAAKSAFDAALALAPGEPELLIGRAQAYAEGGQYRNAVADLDAALNAAPERVDALVFRASARRRLDDLGDALLDVDRALQLAPDTPAALLERGNIRRLAGDEAGAEADWRRVAALTPGSETAAAAEANLARVAAGSAGE
jgi:tetratricopeptide (TPR) repeat protein